MSEKSQNILTWSVQVTESGRRALRIVAAHTGETLGQVLERLALAELARVEGRPVSEPEK